MNSGPDLPADSVQEPENPELMPQKGDLPDHLEFSASAWISNFPLPPPQILGEYEREVPGTSGRFWESIHQEQQNRHQFYMQNAELSHRRIGAAIKAQMVVALVAVLGMIAISIIVFLFVGAGFGTAITIIEIAVGLLFKFRRAREPTQENEAGP